MPKCVYLPDEESKEAKKEAKDQARTRGREMRNNAFEMLGWKEETTDPDSRNQSKATRTTARRKEETRMSAKVMDTNVRKKLKAERAVSTKVMNKKIETTSSESNYIKNKKMWDAYDPELPKIAFRMLAQEYRKNSKQGIEKQVQPDSNSKDRNVLKDPKDLVGSNNSNNSQDLKDLSDDSKDSDWEGNWEVDA